MNASVAYALAQVGKPYKFGMAGPNSFDCSGLTMSALGQVGVHVEHNAGLQSAELHCVPGDYTHRKRLLPGDWVGWYGSWNEPASITHCGLYVGRSPVGLWMVVAAVDEQYGVKKHRMNWALAPSCFAYINH